MCSLIVFDEYGFSFLELDDFFVSTFVRISCQNGSELRCQYGVPALGLKIMDSPYISFPILMETILQFFCEDYFVRLDAV